jgi:hypothetical protein
VRRQTHDAEANRRLASSSTDFVDFRSVSKGEGVRMGYHGADWSAEERLAFDKALATTGKGSTMIQYIRY